MCVFVFNVTCQLIPLPPSFYILLLIKSKLKFLSLRKKIANIFFMLFIYYFFSRIILLPKHSSISLEIKKSKALKKISINMNSIYNNISNININAYREDCLICCEAMWEQIMKECKLKITIKIIIIIIIIIILIIK